MYVCASLIASSGLGTREMFVLLELHMKLFSRALGTVTIVELTELVEITTTKKN